MSKILFSEMISGKLFQNISIKCKLVEKFCTLTMLLCLFQQNPTEAQLISYPKHQIGVGYSSFSGAGLTYQIEINRHHALQFSSLPFYTSNGPDELNIIAFLGGEYQFTLARMSTSRIYTFAGLGITHLEDRLTTRTIVNDKEIVNVDIDLNRINNYGFGIGMEYKLSPRIAVSTGLGILYQTSAKGHYSEFWDRNPRGDTYLGIGGALSFRYVF
jgi:hypothetical protein